MYLSRMNGKRQLKKHRHAGREEQEEEWRKREGERGREKDGLMIEAAVAIANKILQKYD